MKRTSSAGKKFRYGGTSLLLTAAIIAVVIVFNVMFTLLVQRYGIYADLTPDLHFTISDECFDLIGKIDAKDDVDTPIEMLEKFRVENDKFNADAKEQNAQIAKHNESAKKNNDAINKLLQAEVDERNKTKKDGEAKETYTPYEEYKPYEEYIDYTYDDRNTIRKIADTNASILKENNRVKIQNSKWLEAYKDKLPEGKSIIEYKEYVEYKEDPTIKIIFLTDKDILEQDETSKYVVFNADDELRVKYPDHIWVEYVNPKITPSRLNKYRNSPTDTIDFDSVIIECGTEFRIRTLRSFYIFATTENPIGYNGEKAFASSILAVTRAATPVACYTTNHDEAFPQSTKGNEVPFIMALQDAGYEARPLDLAKENIPEECRLLIVFNPQRDFISDKDGISNVSELDKLDAFLHDRNSLMVFMSPDSYTGRLNNLEDFLDEWGLSIKRNGDDPIKIQDDSSSIMGSSSAIIGDYSPNVLARNWMANLIDGKPYVVFPDATVITYPDKDIGGTAGFNRLWVTDPEDETLQYYITQSKNRTVYDLFYSSPNAKGYVDGGEIASATERDPFTLMAVSVQTYNEQEEGTHGALQDSAYVMLCGSTEFASEKYLTSNTYGNADFLLCALQMAGREPVPVGLSYKEFSNYTIETITSSEATTITVVFALTPLVVVSLAGIVILVRRKNR